MSKASLLICVALAFWSMRVSAQSIPLVNAQYIEHYTSPKVSGSLLVGFRFYDGSGQFDPQSVSLNVTPDLRGHLVCLSVASQDAMYYAENLYKIPANASGVSTFQANTHYGAQLGKYSTDQIAVSIRATNDCNSESDGQLIPAQLTRKPRDPVLIADINADPEHLDLELIGKGGLLSKGTCWMSTGSRIAFSSSCEFRLATLPPGPYDLVVHLRERTRTRNVHFPVLIP